MVYDNILFLEEFIGTEWLNTHFEKINTRSPLKGAGNSLNIYHPWVHYMYELEYLLKRAEVNGCYFDSLRERIESFRLFQTKQIYGVLEYIRK